MTDFYKMCVILGELYANYRDSEDFKDFIEFHDLGLPIAFLNVEGMAIPTSDGMRFVEETFEMFLSACEVEDTGFHELDDILRLTGLGEN